jgi:hypothetical protein
MPWDEGAADEQHAAAALQLGFSGAELDEYLKTLASKKTWSEIEGMTLPRAATNTPKPDAKDTLRLPAWGSSNSRLGKHAEPLWQSPTYSQFGGSSLPSDPEDVEPESSEPTESEGSDQPPSTEVVDLGKILLDRRREGVALCAH